MEKHHVITIKGSQPNRVLPRKSKLKLSDRGITKVHKGDMVTWKIGKGIRVGRISSIKPKTGSINVFSENPVRDPKTGFWTGKVNRHAHKGSEEEYTIVYYWRNGEGPFSYDPKIQVN